MMKKNFFSQFICSLILLLFSSIRTYAVTINDFYTAPSGVSIQIRNNTTYPWKVNSNGVLVSGMHKDGKSSSVSFTNRSTKGLCCQFEWSVSSESNCDNLGFSCNGSFPQTISGSMYYRGNLVYQTIFCYIKPGQSLEFSFSKDGSGSSGDDCGYVRNLKFSLPASDDTYTEWGFSTAPMSSGPYVSVIGYYGTDGDVTVPSTIRRGGKNYIPDYIEYDAFRENSVVTSVTMNSGIEEIGVNAFKDCPNLVSVEMANTITDIDVQAFQGCRNLKSVKLSCRIGSLKQYLFDGCTSLVDINIPTSVKSIGYYTFRGCESLESVSIPNSVTMIDHFAFDGCAGLKSVFIPASVSTINDNVFTGCKGLEHVEVSTANQYYDSRNGCNGIVKKSTNVLITGCKNTVIPDDVVGIGTNAFYGCSELKHIAIPESVVGLGLGAFQNCSSLVDINMPEVMMIGAYAFYNCSKLESVVFSQYLESIAHAAFFGCSSLQSLDLPSSLEIIDEAAFEYCENLTNVRIPASVSSLLADVFAYCKELRCVCVEGELTEVVSAAFRHCGNLSVVQLNNNSLVNVTGYRSFDAGYTAGHTTPFSDCTLFVPASSLDAFTSAIGWKQFGTVACAPSVYKRIVYAQDIVARPGARIAIPVVLNSEGAVSDITFTMKLPEGFVLADIANPVVIDNCMSTINECNVECKSISDGAISVKVTSGAGNDLSCDNGVIAKVFVDVPADVEVGNYFAELSMTRLVSSDINDYLSEKSQSSICVKDYMLGDVNQDGVVNCSDVDAVVGILLGQSQHGLLEEAADMNNDGVISVTDCSLIVKLLKGEE